MLSQSTKTQQPKPEVAEAATQGKGPANDDKKKMKAENKSVDATQLEMQPYTDKLQERRKRQRADLIISKPKKQDSQAPKGTSTVQKSPTPK